MLYRYLLTKVSLFIALAWLGYTEWQAAHAPKPLSAEQQAKVKSILDDQQSQAQTVRQDSSLSKQDRHSKMMQLRQTSHEQIRAALNELIAG